ncbi:MAG: tRNA (adenosine(37)-N6)-threonylcarbamoyltransferase complex transferase subunit TsaD [Bacteroidales bacterium]|nr:tRNA (adenosine(37)-N6)-threonylcarbamoyltransferase complex transferase subunit TsaD [Bacteroidales bacterium]
MSKITILGIESSCDDTSASIIQDGVMLSNVIANQRIHEEYGGVVPELASRAHQQNIIPVVDAAIKKANLTTKDIDAIAFTRGPGLLGALLVGTSFAKGFALANQKKLIEINHLQGHILAHFVKKDIDDNNQPAFPFICLLVSGGHTQIVLVRDYLDMEVLGSTIDDAAGEAFDKCAKVMGLPYPGGPIIDKKSKLGNPKAFTFGKPKVDGYNYSFSGLKTSFLYQIRDKVKEDSNFIATHIDDLCASLQSTIIDILMEKLKKAMKDYKVNQVAIAGGVSANSGIRERLIDLGKRHQWSVFLPEFQFTTDNAAMIAITGYYKYLKGEFAEQNITPKARFSY